MIIFDQLRISDDGKQLYINIHVNTAEYFNGVKIDSVLVTLAKQADEASFCMPEDFIYCQDNINSEYFDMVLDKSVLDAAAMNWDRETGDPDDTSLPYASMSFNGTDFSHDLFFVFVKCNVRNATNECLEMLPCALQANPMLGVTFDENMLHQKVMDYTKQLAKDCTVPMGFTDFILQWNAFKASVETEHYKPAIKFFNMLFDESNGINSTGNSKVCGCHG